MWIMTCWNKLQHSSFLLSFSLDARHRFTVLYVVTWQQYTLTLTTQHSQLCVVYVLKLLFRTCSFRALLGILLSYFSRKWPFSRMEQPFYAKHLPFMISMPLWWRGMIRRDSDNLKLKRVTLDKMHLEKIHSAYKLLCSKQNTKTVFTPKKQDLISVAMQLENLMVWKVVE